MGEISDSKKKTIQKFYMIMIFETNTRTQSMLEKNQGKIFFGRLMRESGKIN